MCINLKIGSIEMGESTMDYASFGRGTKNLIMIPGLSEAFATIKGSAFALAMMYRRFAKDYKVYVFGRKSKMEQGYAIKDMARDQAEAMKQLGISKASIVGISQGGMIAQHMAIDYPELVDKLVLAVTVSRQNQTLQDVGKAWIAMAESKDYMRIIIDTAEKSYTEKYIKKYRWLFPVLGRVNKPKDFNRFIIQANACINHDVYNQLKEIKCATLIIGGDSDHVVGQNSSEEMAEQIKGSKLVIYKGLGHATYEEAKDFNRQVLSFLNE